MRASWALVISSSPPWPQVPRPGNERAGWCHHHHPSGLHSWNSEKTEHLQGRLESLVLNPIPLCPARAYLPGQIWLWGTSAGLIPRRPTQVPLNVPSLLMLQSIGFSFGGTTTSLLACLLSIGILYFILFNYFFSHFGIRLIVSCPYVGLFLFLFFLGHASFFFSSFLCFSLESDLKFFVCPFVHSFCSFSFSQSRLLLLLLLSFFLFFLNPTYHNKEIKAHLVKGLNTPHCKEGGILRRTDCEKEQPKHSSRVHTAYTRHTSWSAGPWTVQDPFLK